MGHHYYQIVSCAKALGYFANLEVYQAWVNLSIITRVKTEILFAFHGMGRASTGVIVCSAMYYTKSVGAREAEGSVPSDVAPLSVEPFTLTFREDPLDVQKRFRAWLEDRVIAGLQLWKNDIGA